MDPNDQARKFVGCMDEEQAERKKYMGYKYPSRLFLGMEKDPAAKRGYATAF